jgi:hypothetical protein
MAWVVMLLNELMARENEDYAKFLLVYLKNQIDRGIQRLSPKEYRQMYIKKIPQKTKNKPNMMNQGG